MPDSSEGSAYPNDVSSTDTPAPSVDALNPLPSDPTASIGIVIEARITEAQRLNQDQGQRGRSWALPGRPPALCWTGRARWLLAVDVALATEEGRRLCRARHLSPATARAIARGCADYADSTTGRHLTASNRTIGAHAAQRAGRARPWSHDVVANTRRVLETLGLAVEVVRGRYLTAQERLAAAVHHDCVQLRAASTWALTLVRRWQVKSSLPRRGSTGSKTPRRSNSSNARKRAKAPFGRSPRTKTRPRPIAAQRVTAQLVAQAHGLDAGQQHLGALVDVIARYVDCSTWTGKDLAEVLYQDNRQRNLSWPDRIDDPAAFIAHRLSRLAPLLAQPSPSAHAAAHANRLRTEHQARLEAQAAAEAQKASPLQVARHMETIRGILQRQRPSGSTSVEPRS